MKPILLTLLLSALFMTNLHASGKLQGADFKSETELITAGATKAQLLPDTKIYVTANGVNDKLSTALASGAVGGSPAWVTATVYAVGYVVTQNNEIYKCLTAHTSGTFATDLAAVKWVALAKDAATLTGTTTLAHGGTNATTKAGAFDSLSPMTTGGDLIYGGASGTGTRLGNGTAGQYLQSSGTTLAPVWATIAAGSTIFADNVFDVHDNADATKKLLIDAAGTTGTSTTFLTSQTANRIITFFDATDTVLGRATTDTLTNKSISGSTNTLSNISLTASVTGTLPLANGGTNATTKAGAFDSLSPMTTGGDLIYGGASGTGTRLANGTAGQVLQSNGTTTAPSWVTPAAGGGDLTRITTITASNSGTITFTSSHINNTTYSSYYIAFDNILMAGGQFNIQVSADNCSTFINLKTQIEELTLGGTTAPTYTGQTGISAGVALNNTNASGVDGYLNVAATATGTGGSLITGETIYVKANRISVYVLSDLNCIRFSDSGGNITSGKFILYGRKR